MKPELRVLAASGQLGYGIPEAAFSAGIARAPHVIGADMGSIDPGPAYLGSGRMATSPEMTRRDLSLVLSAARELGVPLLIGSAGTAGARPHLDATLEFVREIASEKGLRFRLASIAADIPKALARDARPLGAMRAMDLEGTTHLVGQMGTEAFIRALDAGADVVVAGRACDTAIFAAIPLMRGYAPSLAMHMAKIIECTSLCCEPGGRDAMLATLSEDSFEL
ncbi:MAG: acyclic terpene utilization AtuA family protein, partial [Proteobacteria bacterium]|nr:acyclic terpene utilization AtuA family protein [Pseudomonadota bacterium]